MDPKHAMMADRGNELNRVKFFLYRKHRGSDADADALIRKYTYPGFQYGAMEHYREMSSIPELDGLCTQLEQSLQHQSKSLRFNHVIGTKYRDGKDGISWHSDKTKDITEKSVIALISLGATREFQLRNIETNITTAFALNAGDLVLIDGDMNLKYKHRLASVKEETIIPRIKGSTVEPRVSLIFRDICTVVKRSDAQKRGRKTEENRKKRKERKNGENRKRERECSDEKSEAPSVSKREKLSDSKAPDAPTGNDRLIAQLQTLLDQLVEKKK
jgi:alkylated DNA repair dioxygenase AlkB